MTHLQTPGPNRLGSALILSMRDRLAFKRALEEFGRLATQLRRRRGFTVGTLAKKSTVAPGRIAHFESANAAPHFAEMLALAPTYRVRLSELAAPFRTLCTQPMEPEQRHYSIGDERSPTDLVDQSHLKETVACIDGITEAERQRLSQRLFRIKAKFIDMTLADWPSILPPSFGTCVRGQHDSLLMTMHLLDACLDNQGAPVAVTETPGVEKPFTGQLYMKAGAILDRSHSSIAAICEHLGCLRLRHASDAAGSTSEHEEADSVARRLGNATRVVAQHLAMVVGVPNPTLEERIGLQLQQLRKVMNLLDEIRPKTFTVSEPVAGMIVLKEDQDPQSIPDLQNVPNFESSLAAAYAIARDCANALQKLSVARI